jgi:outer membrane protein assembly factor BamB
MLQEAGVKGGLVVHLGCGDGRLTAALRAGGAYVVHGLDVDAADVARAREHVRGLGLYGEVSVDLLAGARLPYVDNLVNLLVADGLGPVPMAEVVRVLAPGGVALVGGKKTVKPWPADIDEWAHYLHDAGNNAVADDVQVGPPRSMQWVAPPLWLRSHETPSGFEAMVTSGGRVFYIFDEGLIGITDQRLPERWALVCRDAFNGQLLWKRPVEPWGWPEWAAGRFEGQDWTRIRGARTVVPEENQRRLVADGDRLYATLGYRAPLSILDAATGRVLATVEETDPVTEMVASGGTVVVHTAAPSGGRRAGRGADPAAIVAVDGRTGKVVWRHETAPIKSAFLAVEGGRVVYQAGADLVCLGLADGKERWTVSPREKKGLTLVACNGVVLIRSGGALEARDAAAGKPLWHRKILPVEGAARVDVFVAGGLVWPGIVSADADGQPRNKTPHTLAVGYDLRTGEEKKRLFVANLRSPEHHHRCYRNKATGRYVITGYEGCEFFDLSGDAHSQDNWVRGACKFGIVPANGLLYVPPDQCFCQPGGKLLGLTALAAAGASPAPPEVPQEDRRTRGPAYGDPSVRHPAPGAGNQVSGISDSTSQIRESDWPTYRHDPARHGSTRSAVPAEAAAAWSAALGGRLTPPVVAGGRLYVAQADAHTLHALDAATGERQWRFVAGGRIDSPPTVHGGLVLVGSADGCVYALRAADGALVWRFLAAPYDRRVASFGQVESAWPVHGSVLVRDGVAYVAAGRSTYLDGGIRVWGLDPETGAVRHRAVLAGPWPDRDTWREVAFYVRGANSDVLVAEGDGIYMRQKKLTPALEEAEPPALSSKGEADVGLHVFSTAGLLDGSWYNRTFWMYAKRWPGFQLANQAPKSGQLLVVDEAHTYGVKVFYRRNVHSPMFFPGREGYLLFADANSTEPQIVGEEGAREPIRWLPQSDYSRGGTVVRKLETPAFGQDKGIGYTRADPPRWTRWVPVRVRAMVKAGDVLFAAGPPDVFDPADPYAAFEGRAGGRLLAVAAADGTVLAERALESPPVFDGLIAAGGRLYLVDRAGAVRCFGGE